MKESIAIAKEADAKKGFSSTHRSDERIHRLRDEPGRQFGSLRDVIGNIRRDGSTPSIESIATHLSSVHSTQRAPVLSALQQTHGNRYVQRVVSGIQAKLAVGKPRDIYEQEADRVAKPEVRRQPEEEEETEGTPSMPEFRLTPPSLFGPNQPHPRLRLDVPTPDALRLVGLQLDPTLIRPALLQIDPGLLTPPSPTTTGTVPEPAETPPSESAPLVPAGPGPETPREASGSNIVRAVMAVPAVDTALTNLRTRALEQVERDWGRLSTGEQIATIATTAIIGGGALAGVLSRPETRQAAFDLLNGRTFPVPGVEGLQFEVGIRGNDWTVGFHLDVGALLPASLGFGPSSPSAFGAPRIPEGESESESGAAVQHQMGEPQVQQQIEEREEEVLHAKNLPDLTQEVTPNMEARINAIRGGGQPLPASTRVFFEPHFGYDFGQVQVHTGTDADTLNHGLNARAFTVGQDIFFRQGEYNPGSSSGREILAHELTHVVQQHGGFLKIQRSVEPFHINCRDTTQCESISEITNRSVKSYL